MDAASPPFPSLIFEQILSINHLCRFSTQVVQTKWSLSIADESILHPHLVWSYIYGFLKLTCHRAQASSFGKYIQFWRILLNPLGWEIAHLQARLRVVWLDHNLSPSMTKWIVGAFLLRFYICTSNFGIFVKMILLERKSCFKYVNCKCFEIQFSWPVTAKVAQ